MRRATGPMILLLRVLLPGVLLPGLLLLGGTVAPAQEGDDISLEGYALLRAQPRHARGIPLLPANSFSYIHATYDYRDTPLEVYLLPLAGLTHQGGVLPDGRLWERTACAAVNLEYVADEHLPLWRVRRERYVLYITIPGDAADGTVSVCGFAGPFVEIFEFFLAENPRRIETLRPLPEFPAVLEPAP